MAINTPENMQWDGSDETVSFFTDSSDSKNLRHFFNIHRRSPSKRPAISYLAMELPPMYSPLLNLPVEILQMILEQIDNRADLERLLRACPRLYNILIPYIWRTVNITIRNDKDWSSETTEIYNLEYARGKDLDRLKFVKRVAVNGTSPPQGMCIHRSRDWGSEYRSERADLDTFMNVLEQDSLKSFSWNTATCLSPYLTGVHGALRRQEKLEELKIIVNPQCWDSNLALDHFESLKYLTFRGLTHSNYYASSAVMSVLEASSSTLEEVELGISPSMCCAPFHGFLKSDLVFPLCRTGKDLVLFPKLRVLRLEFLCFENCAEDFVKAIDTAALTSLTLIQCKNWDEILRLINQKIQAMNLKHLELVYHTGGPDASSTIERLLDRCAAIETIAISNGCTFSPCSVLKQWNSYCRGNTDVRSSLRGLVVHQMNYATQADKLAPIADPRRIPVHSSNLPLLQDLSRAIACNNANPFNGSNLEFLGICCFPSEYLQAMLLHISKQNRLQIIHFRKSACDMNAMVFLRHALDAFAEWAFGPQGIPSLQEILLGDFTSSKVRKNANCRYTRKPPAVTESTEESTDLKTTTTTTMTTTTTRNFEAENEPDVSDFPPRYLSLIKACPSQFLIR